MLSIIGWEGGLGSPSRRVQEGAGGRRVHRGAGGGRDLEGVGRGGQNRTCRPITPDKARGLTIHGGAFKDVYHGGARGIEDRWAGDQGRAGGSEDRGSGSEDQGGAGGWRTLVEPK